MIKRILSYIDDPVIGIVKLRAYNYFSRQYKKYMKDLNMSLAPVAGELDYVRKWSINGCKPEPYSYRLFSRYCGQTPDIVPENIGYVCIESALNPIRYRYFYADKNTYSMYIDDKYLPKTLMYRIGGTVILDSAGKDVESLCIPDTVNRVILKPSVESRSGVGVMCFNRTDSGWVSKEGDMLTYDYLLKYGNDFVLQEAVKQHEYISQFCPTSVNTFRIGIYRSVKDDEVKILGSLMRIGKNGEVVDNAHAGGRYVGIDKNTGRLNDYVCDTYGNKSDMWNGIDFTKHQFVIPNWDKIIDFAKMIGKANRHLRLLALDICMDENGNPKLIEYNVEGFSYWLFMFSGHTVFGELTDEVIDYCKVRPMNKVNIQMLNILPPPPIGKWLIYNELCFCGDSFDDSSRSLSHVYESVA